MIVQSLSYSERGVVSNYMAVSRHGNEPKDEITLALTLILTQIGLVVKVTQFRTRVRARFGLGVMQ